MRSQRDANFIMPLLKKLDTLLAKNSESQFSQDSLVANFRLPSAFAMYRNRW